MCIRDRLSDRGFINPQRDVYGVEGDRFVLLRYAPPPEPGEPTIARQLYDLVREHFMVCLLYTSSTSPTARTNPSRGCMWRSSG